MLLTRMALKEWQCGKQSGAVGDFVEDMARAGEELVGFGQSFDGARFAAHGAVGDFGACDGGEQVPQAAQGLAGAGGVPDDPGSGLQTIDAAFAAGARGIAHHGQ